MNDATDRRPSARLLTLQVGLPKHLGVEGAPDPMDRPWTTGSFKAPVAGPVWLGRTNLAGDGQGDLKHHGGPDKAVCAYPAVHYPAWRAELAIPDFSVGAFGENFTLEGVAEGDVCVGDTYAVGEAQVQVSQPRQPCWKLSRRWRVKDLALRVQATGRTGWYFRVVAEGHVAPGSALILLNRPFPEWTIERANRVMHERRHDREAATALAACPLLSATWRETLGNRAAGDPGPDPRRRLEGAT
jgi:MOSC domain-containing protein YiiM